MNKTSIKWTDYTWNPVTGCEKVSAGCKHCYANKIATTSKNAVNFPNGFGLTLHPERLVHPFNLKEPNKIFVNSMSDLFWDEVPQWMVDLIFDVIDETPQHTYQILTKRPERMLEQSLRRPFPRNVWAGVSIENQDQAGRLAILGRVHAKTTFLSCEPLLSPLKLDWSRVCWVITGGESGAHLFNPAERQKRALVEYVDGVWVPRADRVDWVREIRDACVAAYVPFFHKQWGGPYSDSAGNLLDGQLWEEFPAPLGQRGRKAMSAWYQEMLKEPRNPDDDDSFLYHLR